MSERRFACAICGHDARPVRATFREHDSGEDALQWSVPVLVCTYPPCLGKQGATAVPVKSLAS